MNKKRLEKGNIMLSRGLTIRLLVHPLTLLSRQYSKFDRRHTGRL
jgi:hypothetical protein